MEQPDKYIDLKRIARLSSKKELFKILKSKNGNADKLIKAIEYEEELRMLQAELVNLQQYVAEKKERLAILFEGRDAAGKGGAIRRFTEHINPRPMRVVALPKPTDIEKGQWYFQRYVNQLPNKGEIVFFDRSWYNRAVVEPVNGFCTKKQYNTFMRQVPEFEYMLHEVGITIVKFWFTISKEEQKRRFESRKKSPLKNWKLSSVDEQAQELWDKYTEYKEKMFKRTHSSFSPWIIVDTNEKKKARLESIKHILNIIPYDESSENKYFSDPNIVYKYFE